MRFRFCGDADCPDWVLAEITTLSRLSSIKLKLLATAVARGITNPPLEAEKVKKIFEDWKSDSDVDLKRACACVTFILRSAARAGCDAAALGGELQQLGLPREHAQGLRKVFTENVDSLRDTLKKTSLRINKLEEVTCNSVPALDLVEVNLKLSESEKSVRIPKQLLGNILQEAKMALERMQEISDSDFHI